jgi:hypothetical protein
LVVEREVIDKLNRIDEGSHHARCRHLSRSWRWMIATVKIIPFAVGKTRAAALAITGKPLVRVAPTRSKIGVVSTYCRGCGKVVEKTLKLPGAVRAGGREHCHRAWLPRAVLLAKPSMKCSRRRRDGRWCLARPQLPISAM